MDAKTGRGSRSRNGWGSRAWRKGNYDRHIVVIDGRKYSVQIHDERQGRITDHTHLGHQRRSMTEWTLPQLKELLDERFAALKQALDLQAREYERRLSLLNHAHEKAVEERGTFVTQEKYEDKMKAEATARRIALDRVDEKFEEYVKLYERRQREVDEALALMKGAAEGAATAAEAQGRETQRATEEAARRTNRNLVVTGIAVSVIVAVANGAGPL